MAHRPSLLDICRTLKSVLIAKRQLLSRPTLTTNHLQSQTDGFRRGLCTVSAGMTGTSRGATAPTTDMGQTLGTSQLSSTQSALLNMKTFDPEKVERILHDQTSDLPLEEMANPYESPKRICILCKYNMDVEWKNVQLLSQFTSPYTGRIYGRHITGLCIPMQKRVAQLIKRARTSGFMPHIVKESVYLADPELFNPFKPGSKQQYH